MGQQPSRKAWKRTKSKNVSLRKFKWPQEWFATRTSRAEIHKVVGRLGGMHAKHNAANVVCMVYVGALLSALKAHGFDVRSDLLSRRVMHVARQLAKKQLSWSKGLALLFHDATNFPRSLRGGDMSWRSVYTGLVFAVAIFNIHLNGVAGPSHNEVDGQGFVDQERAVQLALDLSNNTNSTRDFMGKGIVVAVVDDGCAPHPDFAKSVWNNTNEVPYNGVDDDKNGYVDDVVGWNFVGNTSAIHALPYATQDNDHGTHVTGTIVAHNPDKGVFGIAYDAKVMNLKVLWKEDSDPPVRSLNSPLERVALAIRYAVDNGAHIINLSISAHYDDLIEKALEYAFSRNVIVIAAAGNYAKASPSFPASSPFVLAVGNAVSKDGVLSQYSNRAGNQTQYVSAPGHNILSTLHNQSYGYMSGTSMAAPYVSGVVARILSANPDLSRSQVMEILKSSSAPSYQQYEESPSCFINMLGLAGFATLCALARKKTEAVRLGKRLGM